VKAFIHSYRTISYLDTFDNGIIHAPIEERDSRLKHPDYKEIIPPALTRRMTKIIRMGVGLAVTVKDGRPIKGIIVGTGLGCLENTEKFMDQFVQRKEGVLAPTAFIQSTHNTIAGQIGLILKDNCYNSTYTQRGMSFENALTDAILLSMETNGNVLVGGLDEKIDLMDDLCFIADIDGSKLGEGASFFLINQDEEGAGIQICACGNLPFQPETMDDTIANFLGSNDLAEPGKYLFGNSSIVEEMYNENGEGIEVSNYSEHSGIYMSNSAFGLQMASEMLLSDAEEDVESILIVNNFGDRDLGLIYIRKV